MLASYRLPGQIPGEKIIKIIRKSPVIFIGKIIFFAALAIMPAVIFFIMATSYPVLLIDAVYYPLLVLAGSSYYLFLWLFFFFTFIDFYLDIFIITDQRLISIRQEGFFSRTIAEQKINRVQDVSSGVHGIMQTIFSYGDIDVQTAAEEKKLFFKEISDPEGVRDIIMKLKEVNKQKENET